MGFGVFGGNDEGVEDWGWRLGGWGLKGVKTENKIRDRLQNPYVDYHCRFYRSKSPSAIHGPMYDTLLTNDNWRIKWQPTDQTTADESYDNLRIKCITGAWNWSNIQLRSAPTHDFLIHTEVWESAKTGELRLFGDHYSTNTILWISECDPSD